ncbi:unnamed protein product [Spirodela intermedia]|uniref:Trichome birefringence-like C-terminal domain-containing protein n=1 Tax=Spirodela intermedia TaxID=51605 RepID=A0A7I8JR49_SPIIN|nr:unnamed protein product [Spirodela intermedia]CAA6672251.1 unnamed protein product [Spirodela intermedia]
MERPWRKPPPPRPSARPFSSCVLTVVLPLWFSSAWSSSRISSSTVDILSSISSPRPCSSAMANPRRFLISVVTASLARAVGEGPQAAPVQRELPFHRNAWNCLRNGREGMEGINSWVWIPETCGSEAASPPKVGFDPAAFLSAMRGRRIGFVGDSLNENFVVSFLCTLWSADGDARKWKKKGAWKGGYFPISMSLSLTTALWQPAEGLTSGSKSEVKGFYRVDVDVPADDWANVTSFYDVLVFNTGHWWGPDKFPKETPLVFYKDGEPMVPPLSILEGLEVVLNHTVGYIGREVPRRTLKFWRSQSPRHFYGGEWNQNGSCLFKEPSKKTRQLDAWFDPRNRGVNKEAREVNHLIQQALQGTDIHLLNITYLSEFRADAHPAIWLGKRDAVKIWGQDCLHWCLPGVPDTWVDILVAQILHDLGEG